MHAFLIFDWGVMEVSPGPLLRFRVLVVDRLSAGSWYGIIFSGDTDWG